MTDILSDVASFFSGLVDIIVALLIPTTGDLSPLQVLMWAGLVFGFIGLVIGLVKRMASSGG